MVLDLHFKKEGSGPAMILMHGLFGSMSNLQTIARHFADRYTVYSIDHRNHGRSPHDDLMDYPSMTNDIVHFINQQQIEEPLLLGHSMGGKVSMMVSLLKPELVKKLIVLDIAPVAYSHNYDNVFTAMQSIDPGILTARTEADSVLEKYFRNTDFRQFLLQNLIHGDIGYEWRLNLPAIIANINKIVGWPEIEDLQYSGKTLFIGGTSSDFIQPKYENKIFQLFPGADIKMLESASHWLHAEEPDKTLSLIENFLQD